MLARRGIFVDTNAFIYYLTGICNELTRELFKMSFMGKVKLVTSSRIVDELLFKMTVLMAKERVGFDKKTVAKPRRDKLKVAELSRDCQEVLDFVKKAKVKVLEVKRIDLESVPEVMRKNGLFGNDAITLKLIRETNIKYLLTSDPDFQELEDVEVIPPL